MRVSLSWVQRLLQVDSLGVEPEELQARLTMHLTEIDAVEAVGPQWPQVVVGRVLSCAPHPNADRLRVTTVDVGAGEPIPVVCGAANVAAGQLVAVALPGAELSVTGADGQPQRLTIKKGKLRGEPSHGMICAEDELGLGDGHEGILVLAVQAAPGTPLAQALGGGDRVLVIDNHNINHRPDLWGQLGWAREISAVLGLPPPADADLSWQTAGSGFGVRLDDPRCTSYHGALVDGVANGPSPRWMQELLEAVGLRPLGLLVDVTNFVMAELGEPMHAFDRRRLDGDEILVRSARTGERLALLDGRTLELGGDDLLIADRAKPLALAGIMGGEASGVATDTDSVVLEAAIFERGAIRRGRMRHGVATESASRFEKGLYPELAVAAINRALALLRESCPGLELRCRFAAGAAAAAPRRIAYRSADFARHTGLDLDQATQQRQLRRLGFAVDGETVTVPWWRQKDVGEAIDLVEEVARLEGYDRIEPELPRMPAAAPAENPLRSAEHRSRGALSGLGWDEIATYGFTSDDWAEALGWDPQRRIRLQHPLSSLETVLRMSLLPTLAEALARNRRFFDRVRCYELGKVYGRGRGQAPTVDEELVISGLCNAGSEDEGSPFYPAREAALRVLEALGYHGEVRALAVEDPELLRGRAAEILVDGEAYARVGELPAALRTRAGLDERVGCFTIALERLLRERGRPAPALLRAPSRFQRVLRDFTFVCPEELAFAELAAAARRAAGPLLREVALAQPVFRSEQLGAGAKAVSLRLALQADDRTLSEQELGKLSERVVKTVEATTAARLRS